MTRAVIVWDPMMPELGYERPIYGVLLGINGDQADVIDCNGDVDCWPAEWLWMRFEVER